MLYDPQKNNFTSSLLIFRPLTLVCQGQAIHSISTHALLDFHSLNPHHSYDYASGPALSDRLNLAHTWIPARLMPLGQAMGIKKNYPTYEILRLFFSILTTIFCIKRNTNNLMSQIEQLILLQYVKLNNVVSRRNYIFKWTMLFGISIFINLPLKS